MIKIHEILKHADKKQKCIAAVGILSSVIAGAAVPGVALIAGQGISIYDPRSDDEKRESSVMTLVIMCAIVSGVMFTFAYL